MKLRKLLTILVIISAMIAVFAITTSAEELTVTMDYIESITTDATETWGKPEAMFDGNIECAGGWYIGNGWAFPAGFSATITFVGELDITSVHLYAWSNWSGMTATFYDAAGTETGKYTNGNFGSTDGAPIDLNIEGIKAKKLVLKTDHSKGLRNHTYTEFVIKFNHEHDYTILDHIIEPPTCSKEGLGEYNCICGGKQNCPVPATGMHSTEEFIAFRNGFTKAGALVSGCPTCDTQDVTMTEIGALFTPLGYSVSETGANGIYYGFAVNYENIELYTELAGYGLEFGIVAYSTNAYTGTSPLLSSPEGVIGAESTVVCKNMTNAGYGLINYKITGFADSYKDTEFVLGGYVTDGIEIFFIGEESTSSPVTVSYNGILNSAN